MTATLNSAANVGDSLSSRIQVYDSLDNDYQAQVTYTKTATNTWSYNVTLPETLIANSSSRGGINTQVYNFGSSGGILSTVDPATNLTITGPNAGGVSTTINAPAVTPEESIGADATDLQNALGAAGITATVTPTAGGQLTIIVASFTTSGSI